MQNKFFGSKLNSLLLLVLIILMIMALVVMNKNKEVYFPSFVEKEKINNQVDDSLDLEKNPLNITIGYHICEPGGNDCLSEDDYQKVLGKKEDLIAFSVLPGEVLSNKEIVEGIISGGYFFEANILINILDSNKNLLRAGHATATSDWMTSEPIKFQGEIDFAGLKKGPGYIEIQNDDPSGGEGGPAKKILIPIIIK